MWGDRHLDQASAGATDITARAIPPLIVLALGAAACLDTGPTATRWEAQLTPEPFFPNLSGHVAAVSGLDGTNVGIGITGAEGGVTLTWRLVTGTCQAPGLQLGPDSDYPELIPSLSGSASADTQLGPRLSVDNTYHAEVRSAGAARMACGNLELI